MKSPLMTNRMNIRHTKSDACRRPRLAGSDRRVGARTAGRTTIPRPDRRRAEVASTASTASSSRMERILSRKSSESQGNVRNRRLRRLEQAQDALRRRSVRRPRRFAARSRARCGQDSRVLRTSEVGATRHRQHDPRSLRERRHRRWLHAPGDGRDLERRGFLSSQGIFGRSRIRRFRWATEKRCRS